ncbi:hypothetical protein [Oscillibacter sp.]|uniref:hypothetical protein n=1 Tax=Oscillibacter sp. TaxID=1945593 RepID=UPI0028A2AE7F|nr:hypothetical protein [Oscillibacter sp.]
MDKIICGGFEWERNPQLEDNRLDGGNLFFANAIAQDELSIDTLEADIFSLCKVPVEFEPSDYDGLETEDGDIFCCQPDAPDITSIPYGTPVEYWRDGVLKARLYKSEIVRAGKTIFNLSAVSAVGLLDKLPHMGGLYTGQRMDAVLADIIGSVFSYTVAPDVAATLIFGWLPSGTKRDNLRQLLFATGAAVRKTADGGINFAFLSADAPREIIGDRMYTGGSLAYNTPATGVDVTEHAYYTTSADTEATLFDNTDGSGAVDHKTVTFDKPCHDLTPSSGLTVHESGVNYAIVTGAGALTGKEYTHQTKIVSRRLEAVTENVVTVKDATLVSAFNSGSVADRVLAYYSGAKTLSVPIVEGGERPGDSVYLEDAFGDDTEGILQSMSITISSTLKADTTIVTGYVPEHNGNNYKNSITLTGAGQWTVPAGVFKIRRTLIGGGDGGSGGFAGTSGSAGSMTQYDPLDAWITGGSSPGKGGEPGEKGRGGKIYADEISVVPGQVINFSCGVGGVGGDAESTGGDGTDTTFGNASSASGIRNAVGFYDYYSNTAFAVDGPEGYSGADGGVGVSTAPAYAGDPTVIRAFQGNLGGDCADGTLGGDGGTELNTYRGDYVVAACGGSAGGAAYGARGANGGVGAYENDDGSHAYLTWVRAIGGPGGNGATALPGADGLHYGCGGSAGHGGGGGGCPGGAFCGKIEGANYHYAYASQGTPGDKGFGSNGGDGADGCVVIYF